MRAFHSLLFLAFLAVIRVRAEIIATPDSVANGYNDERGSGLAGNEDNELGVLTEMVPDIEEGGEAENFQKETPVSEENKRCWWWWMMMG